MNCKQFNNIPLEEVLLTLGHLPSKQNEKEAWYLNPFASESEASFKLDKRLNVWFLHSEGIGGNNTDFIRKYFSCSVKEVLVWASTRNFSSFHKQVNTQSFFDKAKNIKPDYQIDEIKELQNVHLKNYLQERGLSENVHCYVKEVMLRIKGKQLYAIGFENQSGGFELRNSFYKGAVLKKDISVIQLAAENKLSGIKSNHTNNIQTKINTTAKDNGTYRKAAVFEGFMDALSFIELQKAFTGDVLILNSTSLLKKAKEQLKNYSEINLFLDNDNAGRKCKSELLELFPDAKDYSGLYAPLKDLNDYLIYKTERKIKTAEVKTELNPKGSGQQSASQIEPAEFIQQKSLPIPRLQEQVPNEHKNLEETINQEKQQEQTETQNRQSYRRRR